MSGTPSSVRTRVPHSLSSAKQVENIVALCCEARRHCIQLDAAGGQWLRAALLAVFEEEREQREQHRHTPYLLEKNDGALEHLVEAALVLARQQAAEVLEVIMRVGLSHPEVQTADL